LGSGGKNGVRGKESERDRACSPHRKWKQNLKMVVPNPQFYIEELGKYRWSKIMGLTG
jgi:hypothetical protein